jgi:glycerol uptake facilitator-like aquaporin
LLRALNAPTFANPAVTLARALSDTFAGIAPSGVVGFILAQMAGMRAAVVVRPLIWGAKELTRPSP